MNFFNLNLPAKAVLLLGILLIFVSSVRSQSEMIESAKKDYLSGDYSNFSSKMREILDWNIEDPTKEILEGLFLLQDNDLNKRRIAGKLIQKNVPRLRNDPFSDFAMGILYKKQNNHSHAKKYFERAIGKNDRMIAALIELGEYHFREMLKYYNRYTDTEIPMSYRDYALEDYDYAVSYLRRVLRYDPKNKEAAYLLGNLYYEQNEMVYMKQLFQDMLQYYPRDRNLNLFLGLVCLRNREYLEASQYFGNALAVMNDEEKDGFFNPEYLRRDRKDNSHDTLIAHFWSQRDPMFLTGENERLLEHFGRYAYANLRFSVPKLEVEGWKTDRGKTYIRYGRPSYIVEYGKSMELFQGLYPPMQIWVYPEFQLAFSDEFWNGLFQFTQPGLNTKSMFKERTIINYSLVAEDVFRTVPEKFDFSLPGGVFETSYQIKFFKSQEKTEAMLAFSLPVEETLYYPRQKFQAGLFLLNSEKLPFVRFKEDFDLNLERDSSRIIADQLVKSLSFRHTDGTFQYSFEIMNNTLEKNFIDRQKMSIPAYGSDTLMISDIVLADEILPQADSSQIISCYTRNGLNILPNISQYFMQNDTLLVYFELYNLDLNLSGNIHFTVETALHRKDKGGFFQSIFGSNTEKMSIVNEYSGRRTDEFVVQSVQLSNLEPGEYKLEITVRDKNTGRMIRKNTNMTLLEALTN